MVGEWTGREARALRDAKRMSIREFAAHLGVHERLVSKWEAGGVRVRPRPVNQAALDTSLARSDDVVRARFSTLLAPAGDADLLAFVDAGTVKGAVPEVLSERELIMAAAHEVFHCAQRVTWPDAFSAEGSWWMEGSAEYFSNLVYPESRIRDANVAEESAAMTKFNILTQSGIAALAQANQSNSSVLALLR